MLRVVIKYVFCVILALFISWFSFWAFEDYINKLNSIWVDVDNIQKTNAISRYDVAKLLNMSDCFDCITPWQQWKDSLNNDWWLWYRWLPWNNFQDIWFENAIYSWKDYYYCVAYASSKSYMEWYPEGSSPFCPWKFCGANNINTSEFLQIVINILSNYIYDQYTVNWSNIVGWLNSVPWTYAYNSFNIKDVALINNGIKKCGIWTCKIWSANEFKTYMKYCTYNLQQCWFIWFMSLKQWTWPVAEMNILYLQWMLTIEDINWIRTDSQVNWTTLLKYLYQLSNKNQCSFDDDYDKDGIKNKIDNCPNWYNPLQKDTDWDKIWDVCDDDIDGDSILNPIWVVDDKGNINRNLLPMNKDNCIMVPNTDQLDANNNWIWDKCENLKAEILAIYIWWEPLTGVAPLKVDFFSRIDWNIKQVEWDFWDGNFWNWEQVSNIFIKEWQYTIVAKWTAQDWKSVVWKMTLTVWMNYDSKIWFQVKWSPLAGNKPLKSNLWVDYQWEVDMIEWEIWATQKKSSPSSKLLKSFLEKWIYEVIAKWYNKKWDMVWLSQLNVEITDSWWWIWSSLQASNIKPKLWELISLKTIYSWFQSTDINTVEWDFWDWQKYSSKFLNISKLYKTNWLKIIRQNIYLKSWRKMENVLSVFVVPSITDLDQRWTYLTAMPLIQDIWKNIKFNINKKNISDKEVKTIMWDYWDSSRFNHDSKISDYFITSHIYQTPWIKRVQSIIYLSDGSAFVDEATVYIRWVKMCLWDMGGSKCDIDKDWMLDLCDDDIDGDGIKNMLWLIKDVPNSCKYSLIDINLDILFEEFDLASKWGDIDNCPFDKNVQQIDTNWDWIWDDCDYQNYRKLSDSDRDMILDENDVCPTIPENYNWVEDKDWCPEIEFLNQVSSVQQWVCNQCPCQYADFGSQIWKGDKVRAVLCDKDWNTVYNYSSPREIIKDIKF